MTAGHPTDEMLRDYALGIGAEGAAMLVAAHATYCPACRAKIARDEALSGALLRHERVEPMSGAALASTLDRLDAPVDGAAETRRSIEADGILPRPIREVVGPFRELKWRFVMPGVSKVDVAVDGDESVSLLRVRPNCGVPQHTHTAQEATLVVSGALRDRGRVFRRGDVSVATDDDDHTPRAEPGADCICLAVLAGSLRFTGAFGRALNIFAQ
jgi:putative transcriptional regulator